MLEECQETAILEDCLESVIDYRGKTPPKSPSGIPTITAANVKSGRIDMSTVSCVSEETYRAWTTRGFPHPGDVLITTEAPVGEVAPFPGDQTYLITRRVFAMRGKEDVLDNNYLLYTCLSSVVQDELASRIRGSTVPRVLKTDILGLRIPLPPIPEQRAIAHILGTLDDKIELNRKTNDTLEAMAKALFKSWFVDFDPVRAKAEGRPAGLPNEISDLFPDSFEESELGRIPVGWRVAPVGEVVECVGGSTPSTSEPDYWDGGEYFWATPKDLSGLSEPFLLDTAKKVTAEGVQRISSGILPAGTVLLSSRAPVGYVACSCVPISINQGFIAIKAGPEMPSSYLLNWCIDNVQQFKDRATGTTFPEISKAAFRPIPLLVPDSPVLKEFDRSVQAVYESVISNMKESALLVKVRDTLLPKLISGELRIPDAEKLLEEAGI